MTSYGNAGSTIQRPGVAPFFIRARLTVSVVFFLRCSNSFSYLLRRATGRLRNRGTGPGTGRGSPADEMMHEPRNRGLRLIRTLLGPSDSVCPGLICCGKVFLRNTATLDVRCV